MTEKYFTLIDKAINTLKPFLKNGRVQTAVTLLNSCKRVLETISDSE